MTTPISRVYLVAGALVISGCGANPGDSTGGSAAADLIAVATHRLSGDGDSPTSAMTGVLTGGPSCFELVADGGPAGPALVWPKGSTYKAQSPGVVSDDGGETLAVVDESVTLGGGEYSFAEVAEFMEGDLPEGCGNGTYFLVFGSSLSD